MAMSTSFGCRSRARATPSSALFASIVSKPWYRSRSRASFMFFSLSSTSRIRSLIVASRRFASDWSSQGLRPCHPGYGLDGQCEREGAALSGRALHGDRAAVQLDEALRQRETQPSPFARALPTDLAELLEDLLLILGRDADARVAHRDAHGAVLARRGDLDAAAIRREFHRVREQVVEH